MSRDPISSPLSPHADIEDGPPVDDGATWIQGYFTTDKVLSYIGIGLLLLGVGFLFNYAVEQGWLIPPLRVGAGLVIGAGLLGAGLAVENRRQVLGGIMLGGGCAVLYISIFAAYQLYQLTTYPIALGAMIAVTTVSFVLAVLRPEGYFVALIGLIGGLVTPLVLRGDSGNLPALVIYTTLIMSGTILIAHYRRWPSLVWLSGGGAWTIWQVSIFAFVFDRLVGIAAAPSDLNRWFLTGGILFSWLILALSCDRLLLERARRLEWKEFLTSVMLVSTPLVSLFFIYEIWASDYDIWAYIALAAGLIYAAAGEFGRRQEGDSWLNLAYLLMGLTFLTAGITARFEGDILFLMIAAEALFLHVLSTRRPVVLIESGAWLLTAATYAWLMLRLTEPHALPILFNGQALTNLAVIIGLGVIAFIVKNKEARILSQILVYAAAMAWPISEIDGVANGQGIVSLVWGVYAIGLLSAGGLAHRLDLQRVGMVTLFVVAGKLLLIDLLLIDPLWRILMFIGFGIIFLGLSYLLPDIWRFQSAAAPAAETNGE